MCLSGLCKSRFFNRAINLNLWIGGSGAGVVCVRVNRPNLSSFPAELSVAHPPLPLQLSFTPWSRLQSWSHARAHTHTHTHTHTASGSFFIWRLCCIPPPHLSLSRSLFISISSSPSLLPPLPHVPQPHILLLHHHPSLLTRLPPLKTALSSPFYPSSCFLLIFTPCVPLANHRPFTFALALSPSVECLHRRVIKNSCRGRTGCNQVTPLTPVRHLFPSAGPRLRRWSERPLTPVAQELNWAAACRNRMHGGRFHDCGLL